MFKKILCALAIACVYSSSALAAMQQIPLSIPEDYEAKTVSVKYSTQGPKLLFSDSPEMVYHNGILYRDTVQGKVRIFFHHVNAVEGTKKLALMLKNTKMRPVHYKLLQEGVAGPGYNYMEVGKEAQRRYFGVEPKNVKPEKAEGTMGFAQSVELLSGKGVLLDTNELLTGTIDLQLDAPTEVSLLMCEPQTDLELFNENAKIQPMDEHPLRGSFAKSDWEYTLKRAINGNKTVKLKLAGAEAEGYIKGVDATTNLPAENYGNYGVIYRVNFTIDSKQPVGFILNPIGGYFAGYGVLEHNGERKLIALPEYDLALGETVEEAVELGKLKSGKYTFIWSPPGASNLPIELVWSFAKNSFSKK